MDNENISNIQFGVAVPMPTLRSPVFVIAVVNEPLLLQVVLKWSPPPVWALVVFSLNPSIAPKILSIQEIVAIEILNKKILWFGL